MYLLFLFEVAVKCPRKGKHLQYSGTDVNKADVVKTVYKLKEHHLYAQSTSPHNHTYGEELHGVVPPYTGEHKVNNCT